MLDGRSSRALAERLHRDFHKAGNPLRFRVWAAGAAAGLLSLAWLALAAVRGDRTIYEARPVSASHRFVENDCRKCHTDWGPGARLVFADASIRSVDNQKCLDCHDAAEHHATQIPAHAAISCAECHREHQGKMLLSDVSDSHCLRCHQNLAEHGGTGHYATSVERFDGAAGPGQHPEFALQRLLQSDRGAKDQPDSTLTVLEFFARQHDVPAAGKAPRWQDPGRIRFNHKMHLHARYENGVLVEGLRGPDGKLHDWSKNCQACHVPDAAGRYMQPIHYESHCASCHPLLFDVARFPGETVPHERSSIVRGFLTEKYTLNALDDDAAPQQTEARPRDFIGFPSRPRLSAAQAQDVRSRVMAAEHQALDHTHALLGREARGGCRYCHQVEEPADRQIWQIVPPGIPDRWMPHSRFEHDTHRMLDCLHCHRDLSQGGDGTSVTESVSTGDVLMPSIQVCRECHSDSPAGRLSGGTERLSAGARTACIECHVYHHPHDPSHEVSP